MPKYWIYIGGVVAFGLLYPFLKGKMADPWLFVLAITYLLLLRWISEKFGR